MRCLGLRAVSRWLEGNDIGPESSVHKLFWSDWLQQTTDLAMDIMGPAGIVPEGHGLQGISFPAAEAGTPNTTGAWVDYFFRSRAATIYAGSSEIQRNIIGERILACRRSGGSACASISATTSGSCRWRSGPSCRTPRHCRRC